MVLKSELSAKAIDAFDFRLPFSEAISIDKYFLVEDGFILFEGLLSLTKILRFAEIVTYFTLSRI